jgi:hypothetical protein|tara:strand:+ start:33 stop:410 length:378 start_codon:yes stop_codon:yes gene_type:complete
MTREISILQIPKVMEQAVETLVAATTLEWTARVKKATPVRVVYEGEPKGGGQLRNAWQTNIKKFSGTVSNNLPYAEPVCFGENLPPSWNNQYRTRQNTQAGFPELIAKELQAWADGEYNKIKGSI